MANKIVSVKQIARGLMPRLIDNLVFPGLVYTDASEAAARSEGDTVQIRKPVMLEAKTFAAADGVAIQDINEEAVDVTLTTLATVDVAISAWENYDDSAIERLFLDPAAAALAEKVNADGLQQYKSVYNAVGSPGTAPSSLEAMAQAAYAMDVAKIPQANRNAVWSPLSLAGYRSVPDIVNAEKSGTTEALRRGSIGTIFGISNYMSQAVVNHQAGTLADVGAEFTVRDDMNNASYLYIKSSASIGSKTLVQGDIIQIAGKNYRVTADTTAASGSVTEIYVRVAPNLTAAAGTPVTIVKSHAANLLFHPNAFAFVTRPLAAPAGVESYVTTYNGISLRVTKGYDMKYKKEMLSMDILYGYKTIAPELAVRYMG